MPPPASEIAHLAQGHYRARLSLTQRIESLVVAKLDRLSRLVLDFASITELARRKGWAVVALEVDTTTPTGELTASFTSAVAQWERRIIGARTSDALQAMKDRGARQTNLI